MLKFTTHTGIVAPLDRDNVDTDAILPKQYLKSIKKTGFAGYLFDGWRFHDVGYVDKDPSTRKPNKDFILNKPEYKKSSILLTRKNFGCGSSREHAPWALQQYGFRVLLATSFADIFFNNCFKNGLLPIVLEEEIINKLFNEANTIKNYMLSVDLENQQIITPDNNIIKFEVQQFRKYCLLNGLDDIGLTLRHTDKIKAFEQKRLAEKPWLASKWQEN